MAYYTPKFNGVWIQTGEGLNEIENSDVQHNAASNKTVVQTKRKEQTLRFYQKITDADNSDVDGINIAVEDINLPKSGKPFEERLVKLVVDYKPETGLAIAQKVRLEEDDGWVVVGVSEPKADKEGIL